MDLPGPLALDFCQDIFAYEKEKAMPYVTSVERHQVLGEDEGETKH